MGLFTWGDRDIVWSSVPEVPKQKCIGCGIELNLMAPTMSGLCNVCDAMIESVSSEWFVRAQNEFVRECQQSKRLLHPEGE